MKVREIMSRRVHQISASAMLSEAAEQMRTSHTSALPVVENRRIVGLITDRDIAVKAAAAGMNPRTTPVGHVMARQVSCCSEQDEVEEAARIMEGHRVHRLVVLGADGQAVGVLSVGDLALKTDDEYPGPGLRRRSCAPIRDGG
jgi:CBS domain-containing protein